MPTKKRKAARTKPVPPPDDPTVTKYKMFASSKRENGIKVKGGVGPKQERQSLSSQPHHPTGSQFSMVISDSESDGEGGKADSDAGPMAKVIDSVQGKKRALPEEDDDEDEEIDEEIPESEASSSKLSRSDNRAKCSRGRGGTKLQSNPNGHVFRVSSFKPLSKGTPQDSKTNGGNQQSKQANGVHQLSKAKSQESIKAMVSSVKGVVEAVNAKGEAVIAKTTTEMFRGLSDSEDEGQEFHEPTEYRRSVSTKRNSSGPEGGEAAGSSIQKRKASEDSDDDDEDDDHIDSVLGHAVQSEEDPANSEPHQSSKYITREEHEKLMREIREEMKQEVERLKSAMRIETKRLIRAEVKDEILLTQEKQM